MNYKAHGSLLKAYPNVSDSYNVTTIKTCDSLSILREWNAHLRGKYSLLTRYARSGSDFVHTFTTMQMHRGAGLLYPKVLWLRDILRHLDNESQRPNY